MHLKRRNMLVFVRSKLGRGCNQDEITGQYRRMKGMQQYQNIIQTRLK